jgi:hypothetical protein
VQVRQVRQVTLLIFWSCCCLLSCGYHAVYGGQDGERLHVKVMRSMVPDAIAADEVAAGVREQLAREGALEAGEGYPRVEIEVLRADETSEGIAAGTGAAGAAAPVARGTGVALVARAWLARSPDAPPERDTGDVRAEESIAVDEIAQAGQPGPTTALDPRASSFHRADALRAAGRRLGRKLALRVTGQPAASEDTGSE